MKGSTHTQALAFRNLNHLFYPAGAGSQRVKHHINSFFSIAFGLANQMDVLNFPPVTLTAFPSFLLVSDHRLTLFRYRALLMVAQDSLSLS